MLINNEIVTEIDVSNFHPRIIYTLEGIRLPKEWDAYDIEALSWISDNCKQTRSFMKSVYLSVLFSKDKEEAVKSVLAWANKNKNVKVNTKKLALAVVDEILNKNEEIKHYFFEERLWAKLQNVDSRFAKFVIEKHLDNDIVCLGWHDSFVVPKNKQQFLMDTMKEAWYMIFGTYKNFKCDVEF